MDTGEFIKKYVEDDQTTSNDNGIKRPFKQILRSVEEAALSISSTEKSEKKYNQALVKGLLKQMRSLQEKYGKAELQQSKEGQLLCNAITMLNNDVISACVNKTFTRPKLLSLKLTHDEVMQHAYQYVQDRVLFSYDAEKGTQLNTYLTTGLIRFFPMHLSQALTRERPAKERQFWVSKNTDGDEVSGEMFVPDKEPEPNNLPIDFTQLEPFLGNLDPREQQIIRARFGLDTNKAQTLVAIAGQLGVSKERVRQIEQRSLDKLREMVTDSLGDALTEQGTPLPFKERETEKRFTASISGLGK